LALFFLSFRSKDFLSLLNSLKLIIKVSEPAFVGSRARIGFARVVMQFAEELAARSTEIKLVLRFGTVLFDVIFA